MLRREAKKHRSPISMSKISSPPAFFSHHHVPMTLGTSFLNFAETSFLYRPREPICSAEMYFFRLLFLSFSIVYSSVARGEVLASDANLSLSNVSNPFSSQSKAASALQNLQTFTQALAKIQAPPIQMSNMPTRPFMVQSDTFPDFMSAASRTCDVQYNGCSNAANQRNTKDANNNPPKGPKDNGNGGNNNNGSRGGGGGGPRKDALDAAAPSAGADTNVNNNNNGGGNGGGGNNNNRGNGLSIQDCESQRTACNAAQKNAPFQTFNLDNVGPDPAMPDFDLLCAP